MGSRDFDNMLAVWWDYVNHRNCKKLFIVSSSAHALKSPRSKMFLYLMVNMSKILLIISRWFLMLFLRVLYEQLISHFFVKNNFYKKVFSSGKASLLIYIYIFKFENCFIQLLIFRCPNINLLVLLIRMFLRVLLASEKAAVEVLDTFSFSL